jgi:hypothetical protein
MLLRACPGTAVETFRVRRLCLYLAIERRNRDVVTTLIHHGADLIRVGPRNRHALHVAAHYFPSVLMELIDVVELLSKKQRAYKSVKEQLEMRSKSGFSVYGQLLLEGYEVERELAENLRIKYGLDYDYKVFANDGSWHTLTYLLTGLSKLHGLIPVSYFRYLLQLFPSPQFVCSSDGSTILTTVVSGWLSVE